jgi:hypothetical protein
MLKALEERVPYSAIVDRPKLTLPEMPSGGLGDRQRRKLGDQADAADGAAAAVGVPLLPDLPNWRGTIRMRVGSGAFSVPDAPQYCADAGAQRIDLSAISARLRSAVAAGWVFMGHGFVQMPMHSLKTSVAHPPNRRGDRPPLRAFAARLGKP